MPSVISGDANVSATEFGFLDGVTSSLQTQIDSKLPLAGGKILQIVRATDSTRRDTTSTTFVDVAGMSVTITPQKSDSAILIIASYTTEIQLTGQRMSVQITDSSNNEISGGQDVGIGPSGSNFFQVINFSISRDTPATTSATTYKARFKTSSATSTVSFLNGARVGQMYAIEVSA